MKSHYHKKNIIKDMYDIEFYFSKKNKFISDGFFQSWLAMKTIKNMKNIMPQ